MFNFKEKNLLKREFRRRYVILFCLIFIFLFGVVDYLIKTEISFTIFYMIPVFIASWYVGMKAGILFSIFCALFWLVQELMGGQFYLDPFLAYWNTVIKAGIYLIITLFVTNLRTVLKSEQSKVLLLQ